MAHQTGTGPLETIAPATVAMATNQGVKSRKHKASDRVVRRTKFSWIGLIFYVIIGFFMLNLVGLIGAVVVDSFGTSWFNTWLPSSFTTQWYTSLSDDHDIGQLLSSTLFVAICTTVLSLLIGLPASYVLARKQFRFKPLLTGLYLLPMLVPPLAYGVPLAALLLQVDVGGFFGYPLINDVLINIVPIVPFVILILTPFIEQLDPTLESASRMLGANRLQTFLRVLLPLIIPGLLTAGVLAVVRAIAMFELTFLVAQVPMQDTLVVALFGDAFGAGIRANQSIDALAVIYMLTTMSLLGIGLIFVKPTQFVVRLKGQ